jgi:hypothetical protein
MEWNCIIDFNPNLHEHRLGLKGCYYYKIDYLFEIKNLKFCQLSMALCSKALSMNKIITLMKSNSYIYYFANNMISLAMFEL